MDKLILNKKYPVRIHRQHSGLPTSMTGWKLFCLVLYCTGFLFHPYAVPCRKLIFYGHANKSSQTIFRCILLPSMPLLACEIPAQFETNPFPSGTTELPAQISNIR